MLVIVLSAYVKGFKRDAETPTPPIYNNETLTQMA